MFRFVYVLYGHHSGHLAELRYSLEGLLAEGVEPDRILIYTDRVTPFAGSGFEIVDVSDHLGSLQAQGYPHRIKPAVLLDAVERYGDPVVLLDTDSFIRDGFLSELSRVPAGGAAMNFFVRRDPYPWIKGLRTALPGAGLWTYDAQASVMFNSGLVAIWPRDSGALEDALALIDFLWASNVGQHDIEQFAISEALRLRGVPVATVDRRFEHYCQRWSKRYMHRHFAAQRRDSVGPVVARRPSIPFSKSRVRFFKAVVRSSAILSGLPIEAFAPIPSDLGASARLAIR